MMIYGDWWFDGCLCGFVICGWYYIVMFWCFSLVVGWLFASAAWVA